MASIIEARADVEFWMDADKPVMLWGDTGIGKSALPRAIAADRGLPLIDFRAVLRDRVDIQGIPAADLAAGVARWLPFSDLPNEERHGPEGILFLDEINAAPAGVQAALFGLVLERRAGEYVVPPRWRLIAAGNRQSDGAAAQRMPSALEDRFKHVTVDVDIPAWIEWAHDNGLHPAIPAFIDFSWRMADRPVNFLHTRDRKPAGDPRFATPRSVADLDHVMRSARDAAQRRRLVAQACGDDFASEFEAFLRLWAARPDLSAIVADPDGAPVPTESASVYAVASYLSRKADASTFGAILRYARRLPGDYETFIVTDSTRRTPALRDTAAYVQWAARNASVLI
jgi:hypothetical protein